MRALNRLRNVQRALEPVVFAVERLRLVGLSDVGPHLQRNLYGLLQQLEATGQRGERHTEPTVFFFVPRRPDAEVGAPSRKHIQCRGRLDQNARMAIRDPRHHRAQLDAPRAPCGEGEGAPAFQHVVIHGADNRDLEEVIHHPQAIKTGALRPLGDGAKRLAETGSAPWPGEIGYL